MTPTLVGVAFAVRKICCGAELTWVPPATVSVAVTVKGVNGTSASVPTSNVSPVSGVVPVAILKLLFNVMLPLITVSGGAVAQAGIGRGCPRSSPRPGRPECRASR